MNQDQIIQLRAGLIAIAAEAFVPLDELPDHDQPNDWRRIAVERINMARALLKVMESTK